MTNETKQYGPWQPWPPEEVARFFSALTAPWWIAGGWALDLFLGMQTRAHEDLDVLFLRRDQHEIRAQFQGWDIQEAHPELLPGSWPFHEWKQDTPLSASVHDIWCRPHQRDPWVLQLMAIDTSGDHGSFVVRHRSVGRSRHWDGEPRMAFPIWLQKFSCSTRPRVCAPGPCRLLMGRVVYGWLSPLLLSILDTYG